jgi:hypothetical protein
LTKKLKTKSKFYFNDLSKILEMKPRVAKKIVNQLVQDGVLEYWSSGSTSMYGLPGTGKQAGPSTKTNFCLRRRATPRGLPPPCTRF